MLCFLRKLFFFLHLSIVSLPSKIPIIVVRDDVRDDVRGASPVQLWSRGLPTLDLYNIYILYTVHLQYIQTLKKTFISCIFVLVLPAN